MNKTTRQTFNPIMDQLLQLRTQPFRQRLKIALSLISSAVFFYLVTDVPTVIPINFLPVMFAIFLANWLLGLRYTIPISLLTMISIRLLLTLFNQPYPIQELIGRNTPFFVFIVLMIVGSIGAIFGELTWMLYRQYEQTQSSEQRYRRVVENTSDVIYITTPLGYFSYVSPSIKTMTGYEPEALIGKDYKELIPPHWHDRLDQFYREQFQKRIPETTLQFPIRMKDGREKWVEQRVGLQTENTHIIGFHSIVRDIQIWKDLEEEIKHARDEAIKMSEVKSQIIANVSHDSRTPLSGIMTSAELLLMEYYGPVTDEQKHRIQVIIDSSNQLLGFLQKLVYQAQLDVHALQLNIDAIEVAHLLESVEAALKPLADSKGLVWKSDISPDMPPIIQGDEFRLQQVITNLVNNAIKFTDNGGIELHLARHNEKSWSICVRDTGIGISAEDQKHIFEPFWQVDGGATRKIQTGVGLGLTITERLVALMNGSIELTSEAGKGSTFQVILPTEQPEPLAQSL